MKNLKLDKEAVYRGDLILVNAEHPLRAPYSDRLAPLESSCAEVSLAAQAQAMLSRAFRALGCGDEILPVSGYRTRAEQEALYRDSLKANGPAFTRRYVALPGCSEHETGLAVDLALNKQPIDFIRPDFPNEGVCRRFRLNAGRFGFVERYGRDKEAVTGIACEPWHFRYVGYPHSAVMNAQNLSLEEYVDWIKGYPFDGGGYRFSDGRRAADIFYLPADRAAAGFTLPDGLVCQHSGNNADGFILTVWRERA